MKPCKGCVVATVLTACGRSSTALQLQQEAEERFRLGQSVASTAHDLNDERTRRSNLETALRNANERIEERERDLRELQSAVDRLSAQDGTARSTQASVQAENTKLLLRIQELEANNQQLSYAVSTNSKPRPSSGAGDRVVFLEQQLSEVQAKHKRDAAELRATAEKLGRAQADRDHAQNQLSALQRSSSAKEVELRDVLSEKDEELEYLRAQTGGTDAHSREDQLLARIEEEETKVQTLELTIHRQQDELDAKKGLDRQLQALQRKVDSAARQVDELSAQLSRSEQQKRSVDARLATVQADAETASSRFSELQRDHRRVVDENSCVTTVFADHC
jgi:chromosome segregation ATPase